jgi:hypothetical protein
MRAFLGRRGRISKVVLTAIVVIAFGAAMIARL